MKPQTIPIITLLIGGFIGVVLPAIAVTPQIIAIEDEVELKRPNWSRFHLVGVGTTLQLDDWLRPLGGGVEILCPDETISFLPAGNIWGALAFCPTGLRRGRPKPNALSSNLLGGTDPSIPYIISPRRTLILDPCPTLRWNAVANAQSYHVTLTSPTGVLWQQSVNEATIVYPGTPSLEPGIPYLFTVKTDTGISSQAEQTQGLDFILLAESDLEPIHQTLTAWSQLNLSPQAEALARAELLADYPLSPAALSRYAISSGLSVENLSTYGLVAGAIETLEQLVKQPNANATIHRTLADLYWQSGLLLLAEQHYLQVIQFGPDNRPLEDLALSQYGLAILSSVGDDPRGARQWLERSRDTYRQLGDHDSVLTIEQQLNALPQP
jgi:hypothetical protein